MMAGKSRSVLQAKDLNVSFGGIDVVKDVSLELPAAGRIGLIGPNGAGKTTVINAISGIVKPGSGRVYLKGREVTSWPLFRRARAGMGRTFQNLEPFRSLSVSESLRVPLESFGNTSRWVRGREEESLRQRVRSMTAQMGLEEYSERRVGELPYGLRKLVEVGRSLIYEPAVVLLDEPAAGLDSAEKTEFVEMVDAVVSAIGAAMLLVEHDMGTVQKLCPDDVIVMDAGAVIARGCFSDVARDPMVVEAYLGGEPAGDEETRSGET